MATVDRNIHFYNEKRKIDHYNKFSVEALISRISLAWPDRFFPFLFVVSATTNKNGKKRSGHARLLAHIYESKKYRFHTVQATG